MTQNLMHTNSNNIGITETIADYKRLFINNKVGLSEFYAKMNSIRVGF